MRARLVLFAVFVSGCARLVFLKPPSVPRAAGTSHTERGALPPHAMPARPQPATDWSGYNNTPDGARFSPLEQITPRNAHTLQPVCTFDLGERAAMESGPVVVDGVLFVTTARNTYAIDAATCALRWKHTYAYAPAPPYDLKVNRGVAYADGRLYRGANDGRVYALDATSGEEIWNVVTGDPSVGETFPAAPAAWGGLVFIGNAGGDNFGVTGRMMALDGTTGGVVWSTELIARHGAAGATWPAETELFPRGGSASWTTYTVDSATGIVYVPTGNAAPDFLPEVREGRNLHAYSVVALDARTGALLRSYPILEQDYHDWDVAAAPALITTRGGREILAVGGKDGHLYGVDRRSLAHRYATAVTTIDNIDAPLTAQGTRFCPGVNGGIEWNGPAYSTLTNLLYVNSIDWCTTVTVSPPEKVRGRKGLPWTGSSKLRQPFGRPDSVRSGWLTAVDADAGTVRWRYASPTPLVAGVTVTAGGVVFTGDLDGEVLAFDAADGRLLWQASTAQPIGGGVVSYQAGRRQLVAVAVGLHAPTTWQLETSNARIVVYGLP
ncbi:MAG: PQQ-binding-like beta-propeller repeat protein [Gemmatimonadales bacterium]